MADVIVTTENVWLKIFMQSITASVLLLFLMAFLSVLDVRVFSDDFFTSTGFIGVFLFFVINVFGTLHW